METHKYLNNYYKTPPERFIKKNSERVKKGKGSFYIAQYPVRWTAQSALHFLPSLGGEDLHINYPRDGLG